MAEQHRQGFYDACDGKGWQKCDEGMSVWTSARRDDDALYEEKRRRDAAMPAPVVPKFHVGQVISEPREYVELPVGATLWPEGCGNRDFLHWVRIQHGYRFFDEPDLNMVPCWGMHGRRAIRSLPTEAA